MNSLLYIDINVTKIRAMPAKVELTAIPAITPIGMLEPPVSFEGGTGPISGFVVLVFAAGTLQLVIELDFGSELCV